MAVQGVLAEPVSLEYASSASLVPQALRPAAKWGFALSIWSGLCVAVCFVVIIAPNLLGSLLHLAVFGVTIAVAIRCGIEVRRLEPASGITPRMIGDLAALLGLLVFAFVPILSNVYEHERTAAWLLLVAFGPLALTTARHVPYYHLLATQCRILGSVHGARAMLILGWFKTFYEGLWLGTCFAAICCIIADQHSFLQQARFKDDVVLFASLGLFGAIGFSGVWIWMMIVHGLLFRAVRRIAAQNG